MSTQTYQIHLVDHSSAVIFGWSKLERSHVKHTNLTKRKTKLGD